MTAMENDNIFGFYASFHSGETEQDLIKQFLWGNKGLKEQLKSLKWQEFGEDFQLILFEIYVNPIPHLRDSLKDMGSYRRKEKSIGIPIIIDHENFFSLSEINKHRFFRETILKRIELLKEKIKRNKLDLDVDKLQARTNKLLIS